MSDLKQIDDILAEEMKKSVTVNLKGEIVIDTKMKGKIKTALSKIREYNTLIDLFKERIVEIANDNEMEKFAADYPFGHVTFYRREAKTKMVADEKKMKDDGIFDKYCMEKVTKGAEIVSIK